MRSWIFLIAIFVCYLLVGAVPALCGEKRVALVIGNSAYQNVGQLPNPQADAEAVAALLKSADFDITMQNNLGKKAMRDALRAFASKASGADVALIFYAGHGMEAGGKNFLIPVDAALASSDDVEDETVSLDRLRSSMADARRLRVVILDACRSNPFLKTMKLASRAAAPGRGLAAVEAQASEIIAFAAAEGRVASDGTGRHSPYTTALLRRLTQPGVDVRKLFGYIYDDVRAATAQEKHGPQKPATYAPQMGGEDVVLISKAVGPSEISMRPAKPTSELDTDPSVKACDRLASAPSDKSRPADVPGVTDDRLDGKAAVPVCRAAFNKFPKLARIQYELARALHKTWAYKEALDLYKSAAEAGHVVALVGIGELYRSGKGVAKDHVQAMAWFRRAAEQGNADAQLMIGLLFLEGEGISKDFVQAMTWSRKAAEQGHALAQFAVGLGYANAIGVTQDYKEAMVWYRKAAEQGSSEAQHAISEFYREGKGVKQDDAQAQFWSEKAARTRGRPVVVEY